MSASTLTQQYVKRIESGDFRSLGAFVNGFMNVLSTYFVQKRYLFVARSDTRKALLRWATRDFDPLPEKKQLQMKDLFTRRDTTLATRLYQNIEVHEENDAPAAGHVNSDNNGHSNGDDEEDQDEDEDKDGVDYDDRLLNERWGVGTPQFRREVWKFHMDYTTFWQQTCCRKMIKNPPLTRHFGTRHCQSVSGLLTRLISRCRQTWPTCSFETPSGHCGWVD
jgi:hypothetical protein